MAKRTRKAARPHRPDAVKPTARAELVDDGKSIDGRDLDELRRQFETDTTQWDSAAPDDKALDMAGAYWLAFPSMALNVSWFPPKSGHAVPPGWAYDPKRAAAYNALVTAHKRATHFLMEAAERLGIDSTAIFESAETCRQLCSDSAFISMAIGNETWPTGLEERRDKLPPGVWDTAQKGMATLTQLSAKMASKPDDGQWSKPDGPTQWAKRFGFSPDTLMRRFKEGVIRHKELSAKSYCIHVSDLPK